MKIFSILLFTILICNINLHAQGVGINNTATAPDASAMLDVSSTTKGFLPPRMTLAQRNLINQPATGILIYQTDGTTGLYCNKGTAAVPDWQLIGPVAPLSYGYFSGNTPQDGFLFQQELLLFTAHAADGITLLNNLSAVVSKTGLYRIAYQLTMETNNSSAYVNIAVNGVNTSPIDSRQSGTLQVASMTDERIISLNAGDAVSITLTANSNTASVTVRNRSLFITQLR